MKAEQELLPSSSSFLNIESQESVLTGRCNGNLCGQKNEFLQFVMSHHLVNTLGTLNT